MPPATIALRAQRVECVEATGEQGVEKAARLAGMSMSAFYRDFQAITTMSPIRFQKRIRLQVADSSAWTSALRGGW
ncbi:hypothetical protein [Saccharothrix coeruleofusca]|uniref:hypothetical protein n=1 Tax=Saccharothrix coeruleofusca TaxID=33919 RepID=UPI001E58343C|nr:hypothetical protein [Saccharothrix coeruleofusca]